ncbi:MAG: hypothetical protein WD058_08235 [Dehalococcoidia bacterium]
MPLGEFLEDFPGVLFVAIHVVMVGIGLWAIFRLREEHPVAARALWLYVAVHPVFWAFWAGLITLKAAAVTEQTLIMAMVVWIALGARRAASRAA